MLNRGQNIKHNKTQRNETQHNDTQCIDTQHNGFQQT
jgi:hypothetical protein